MDRPDRNDHPRAARRVSPPARGLTAARSLADALDTLERRAQVVPLDVNPATASLYIVNPLRTQGVATLFSTHPPIAERVRRLRALDGELAPIDARALLEARTR
jgi:hypothetical protein